MKRILLLLTLLLCLTLPNRATAGENDWHIGFAPSYHLNPFKRTFFQGAQLSIEKEIAKRQMIGAAVTANSPNLYFTGFQDAKYDLLVYWKPYIALFKNSALYISIGGNVGTEYGRGITFGGNVGLEYSITLSSRIKFFTSLDNILSFRSVDNLYMTGLSAGIRIPLTK